jgi:ABC-type sulfate transport system substrate-binding protein
MFVQPEPQLGFAICRLYFRPATIAQNPMLAVVPSNVSTEFSSQTAHTFSQFQYCEIFLSSQVAPSVDIINSPVAQSMFTIL